MLFASLWVGMNRLGWVSSILGLSLLWAQQAVRQPWTKWNIYRDSTGTGRDSVDGQTVCPGRYWLVIDTTGMAAQRIIDWRWRDKEPLFSGIIIAYDEVNSSLVGSYFPNDGLPNRHKIGIDFIGTGYRSPEITLTVYFSNGDSATMGRLLVPKRGQLYILEPEPSDARLLCPGSRVTFRLAVSPDVDSFKVAYGPNPVDTLRGTTTFTLTVPNAHPWEIELFTYACGSESITRYSYPTSYTVLPTSLSLYFNVHPFICQGDSVFISPDIRAMAGLFIDSVTILNANGDVIGGLRLDGMGRYWTPPAAGKYRLTYSIKYPCTNWLPYGHNSWDTLHLTVYEGTGDTLPAVYLSAAGQAGSCPGTPVHLTAYGVGTISWDLNNDGEWDTTGYMAEVIFTGPRPHRFRIRQALPCISRIDTIDWEPPTIDSLPLFTADFSPRPLCPGDSLRLNITPIANFLLTQPNSHIEITASWLNNAQPFHLWTRLDTLLAGVPSQHSNPRLTITLTNGCSKSQTLSLGLTGPHYLPLFMDIFGATCRGAEGRVFIKARPFASEAPYQIRYILPNGQVIAPSAPTDTVAITYPAGDYAYVTVERSYRCLREVEVVRLPRIEAPPLLRSVYPHNRSVCANDSVGFSIHGENISRLRIFVGDTLSYEGVPPYLYMMNSVYNSFFLDDELRVPRVGGMQLLRVIGDGCGGERDTLIDTLYVRPLPRLSGLTLTTDGRILNYQVSAQDADEVRWEFGDGNRAVGTRGTHTYTRSGTYTIKVYARNECGTDSLSQTIDLSVSLVQANNPQKWILYPNPAVRSFVLASELPIQAATVLIIDATGHTVAHLNLEGLPAQIPITLPAGIYTVRVLTPEYPPANLRLLVLE